MNIQPKTTTLSSSQPHVNIPRPLTPILTTEQQQKPVTSMKKNRRQTKRTRCHGNRKLRRFKKKWIKRGLNKEEIQKLIDEYNRKKNASQLLPNKNTKEMEVATTTATKNKETKIKSNKRKRMSTSTSLRSITQQQVPKKMKQKNVPINPVVPRKSNYRLPKYLKKAPNLLFQALRLQLKKKLNKKTQQRFLHYRLQLIDQQYRLKLHRNLWQSYLTLGSEHQT
jgi:hypothetical protein